MCPRPAELGGSSSRPAERSSALSAASVPQSLAAEVNSTPRRGRKKRFACKTAFVQVQEAEKVPAVAQPTAAQQPSSSPPRQLA